MKKIATKNITKKNKIKPSKQIDDDSYELLQALENGEEFEQIEGCEEFISSSKKAAKKYFKKDARVSFRISSSDLLGLKTKAAVEGIPYQTLLSSIVHKFNSGLFIDVSRQ
jgi:predicted DNA binding CopG/RHH family protein